MLSGAELDSSVQPIEVKTRHLCTNVNELSPNQYALLEGFYSSTNRLSWGLYETSQICIFSDNGQSRAIYDDGFREGFWYEFHVLFENKRMILIKSDGSRETKETPNKNAKASYIALFINYHNKHIFQSLVGKKSYFRLKYGEKVMFDMLPALDPTGSPCMFDTVTKKPFHNSGTGQFVAGFTLAQARKLSKLPSTGGTLTISLPTGYEADAGVVSALETARSNGWTLTIQTYTPETATASVSTFALRRVWVRRTQGDNGTYVDADGSRWRVDWCVAMYTPDGSEPDAYGYELFRSVEAAVAYWELEPWVAPEAEKMMQDELLTNQEQ